MGKSDRSYFPNTHSYMNPEDKPRKRSPKHRERRRRQAKLGKVEKAEQSKSNGFFRDAWSGVKNAAVSAYKSTKNVAGNACGKISDLAHKSCFGFTVDEMRNGTGHCQFDKVSSINQLAAEFNNGKRSGRIR